MASELEGKVSDPFCGGFAKGLTLFLWRDVFPRGWVLGRGVWLGVGRVVVGLLGLLELFLAENVIARIRCLPAGRVLSSLGTGLVARHGVAVSAVPFQSVYYNLFAASS